MLAIHTLTGKSIRLEPLTREHIPALSPHFSPQLLHYFPFPISTLANYLDMVLQFAARGEWAPFAIISNTTGEAIGSTAFLNIELTHRRVEVGGTWIGPTFQKTGVNPESKLLLMDFAFNSLDCNRVELKTDSLNLQSHAAMTKLGFQQEGVLRNHMVMPNGRIRHTVYFSVIKEEWPAVRPILLDHINRSSIHPNNAVRN